MTLQRVGVVELKGAGAWLLMLALALLLLSAPARAGWPGIQDWQIDWGTDALQVEAGDMPVTDGAWTYLNPATADVQATFDWLDANWPGANYWQLNGTDLSPATPGNDVLLGNGESLGITEAAASTECLFLSVTGDGNPRLSMEAGGTLNWGSGAAATDIELSRSAAYTMTLDGLLRIEGSASTTGNTFYVGRNQASGDTNDAMVEFKQLNAGDNQNTLEVVNAGNGCGIKGESASQLGTGDAGIGMRGKHTHATGGGYGFYGTTDSSSNAAYGMGCDQGAVGNWLDFGQESSTPDDPPGTASRVWLSGSAILDHHLYMTDEDGNDHDLTVQAKHIVPGNNLVSDELGVIHWLAQQHAGASVPAAVGVIGNLAYDWTNQQFDTCAGVWVWNGVRIDPDVWEQSDVIISTGALRGFGDGANRDGNCRIIVKAMVYLSNAAHFNSVKLVVSDMSADNSSKAASADFKASASGAWYEATIAAAGTDVGGWDISNLCAGIEAYGGDLDDLDQFPTEIRIRWISVEMAAD